MRALTFDVICRAVFGVTEPDRVERLRAALAAVIDAGAMFFLPGPFRRDFGPWSPWVASSAGWRSPTRSSTRRSHRRRAEPDLEERTDVLSLLLRARDEDGRAMSDAELRDELMTMLAAGHETTATGLAFAFDLLLRHPQVLARLREELASGDDAYLEATVTESLRLRPVIDATERTLKKPRVIAGWELPAGHPRYPAIVLIHRREDLYPEPIGFAPSASSTARPSPIPGCPFGGGHPALHRRRPRAGRDGGGHRIVLESVELEPVRPEADPVVLRGITLVPRHGVPVRAGRARGRRSSNRALASTVA